eukprot:TRINITY_DN107065_c0_g1_i1.p1 TRINITY_DN107065_c0_g1~~TRINITY_DN107065_c0_g1_i1.p1  ORF type:complete len:629 (+),score=104.11 TRINITY_DN107065_c0_g1_i1:59-1888(+)
MGMGVDRSALLRCRSLMCSLTSALPTHDAVRMLHTTVRVEGGTASMASWRCRVPPRDEPRPPQARSVHSRPRRFQRPTREGKVHQARLQATECCSLCFDAVDPFQQEGMTRRMLVLFKSLEDSIIYWDGEMQHKEHVFELLCVPETGMSEIRTAVRCASELIEERRYRCAYEALSNVRRWLLEVRPDLVEPTAASDEATSTVIFPQESTADFKQSDPKPVEIEAGLVGIASASGLAEGVLHTMPVKNTFIHFSFFPAPPRRSCSAPAPPSFTPEDVDGDAWITDPLARKEGCHSQMEEEVSAPQLEEEPVTTQLAPCSSEGAGKRKGRKSCLRRAAHSKVKSPRQKSATDDSTNWKKHSQAGADRAGTIDQKETSKTLEPLTQTLGAGVATHETLRVRNTFIDIDEDSDAPAIVKRSSSAPARILSPPLAAAVLYQGEPQVGRIADNTEGDKRRARKKKKSARSSRLDEEYDFQQERGPAFYRYEFTECCEKLNSAIPTLHRNWTLPMGKFELHLHPEGSSSSKTRRGATFQESMGHAECSVRCISKPAPDVTIAVSLGGESLCGVRHDFSKKTTFRLPKALDLWSAVDAKGFFVLKFTLLASGWESRA